MKKLPLFQYSAILSYTFGFATYIQWIGGVCFIHTLLKNFFFLVET